MKKNVAPARIETKPAKTLFGIKADELKAVHGGGGVIGHIDNPPPPPVSGT